MGTVIEAKIGDHQGTRARDKCRIRAPKLIFPLLSMALAGCAIHPVQKDETGFRTVDIVDRIRCERRLAIQDKAIAMLRDYAERTPNRQPIAITADLAQGLGRVGKSDPRMLDR